MHGAFNAHPSTEGYLCPPFEASGLGHAFRQWSSMKNWIRKLEVVANVAIVVVAVFIVGVVVRNQLRKPRPQAQSIAAGTRLSIPNVDWSRRDRTLVMALQQDCSYCSASAPFYRRVVQETRGNGRIGLVAVLPQEAGQARDYLHSLGIDAVEVRQLPLRAVGVAGTPTLALVDSKGIVVHSWLGKLSASSESEVLSAVADNGGQSHG